MEIKFVEINDLPELVILYQQLIPSEISISKMTDVLEKNKENPNHIILAAGNDGKMVGTLLAVTCEMLFGLCQSFMVIEDVIVDREHRRAGVGAALMKYAEEYARNHNCSYIMLITDSGRVGSQGFYKSIGYRMDEYCAFKKKL